MRGSFAGVGLLAGGEGLVLRMIKEKMADLKFGSQAAGIQRGAVVFFVGFEALAIRVEAKGLAQEPIGALGIGSCALAERLIPQADERARIRELQAETVLNS